MDTVRAISGHREGEDTAGVPHEFEVSAGACRLAAAKINERQWRVVGVCVVVKDAVGRCDGAAASGPRGIVRIKLGVIGGDGRDGDVDQRGTSSGVSVGVGDFGATGCGQGSVGCIKSGCCEQLDLVGIGGGVAAVGKELGRVVVEADRDGHGCVPFLLPSLPPARGSCLGKRQIHVADTAGIGVLAGFDCEVIGVKGNLVHGGFNGVCG